MVIFLNKCAIQQQAEQSNSFFFGDDRTVKRCAQQKVHWLAQISPPPPGSLPYEFNGLSLNFF